MIAQTAAVPPFRAQVRAPLLVLAALLITSLVPGLSIAQGGMPGATPDPTGQAGSQPGQPGRILGRVVNGTTGNPVAAQDVRLLMPRQGMAVVGTTKADGGGLFEFSGADIETRSFYLLEAVFHGSRFHAPVMFREGPTANIQLTVYEPTSSASVIRVQSLQILVAASGAKVRVRDEYHVENSSQPPRTYADPKGTFRFTVPRGVSPQVTVTGLLNMPLPQTPESGKLPGQFVIHYPLEPGATTVSVEYDTSYSASGLSVGASVPYPVERADLYVFPSSLKVKAGGFKPAGMDAKNNIAGFQAENLAAGKQVEIAVSGEATANLQAGGGGEAGQGEGAQGQQGEVKIVSNPIEGLAGPILGCFLLVLLWAFAVRTAKEWPRVKQQVNDRTGKKPLGPKAEKLLNSMADLDEIFASGKIVETDYWKERLELKARLVETLRKRGAAPAQEPYASRRVRR